MRKPNPILFIGTFTLILIAVSCSNKPQDVREIKENEAKIIAEAEVAEAQTSSPTFTFITKGDDISPKTEITISYGDLAYTAEEQGTCSELKKEDFSSYQIPNADAACQCWWAGSGADYYVQKAGETVEVYRRDAYEETPAEELQWKLVKVLAKKQ